MQTLLLVDLHTAKLSVLLFPAFGNGIDNEQMSKVEEHHCLFDSCLYGGSLKLNSAVSSVCYWLSRSLKGQMQRIHRRAGSFIR